MAEEFIALQLRPEQQAAQTTKLGYGSANPKTTALLDPALIEQLNKAPANVEQALPVDVTFLGDHGEDEKQRVNAWAAKAPVL